MLNLQKFNSMFFLILLCTPGCKRHTQAVSCQSSTSIPTQQLKTSAPKTEHHLMVFIHGTLLPFPSLGCLGSALHTFLAKGRTLKKSWYQLYIDNLKHNSLFKYQPNGPDGLCPINASSSQNASSSHSAQIAAALLTNFYQELFPHVQLSCYTFGWNGRLSHKKRVTAAHELYCQLINELKRLNPKNTSIILIGHSHGGNVILNLAQAEETYKQHLVIDKAILLGMPVQSETQSLIASPVFKSVYNCYSNGDGIQRLDFISTKDDYSQRRFNITQQDTGANKLTQIELTLGQYEPGHCELWLLWGKDNTFYREKLPIFPLPTFIFLPEIIQQLEKVYPKPHDVLANIDQKDSTYTLAIYDKSPHQEQPCSIDKELTIAMLPKKVFAPYVQAILQNEQYTPRQANT